MATTGWTPSSSRWSGSLTPEASSPIASTIGKPTPSPCWVFSLVSRLFTYVILRLQPLPPLNHQGFVPSFECISFLKVQ